jgi:hypothetical protein
MSYSTSTSTSIQQQGAANGTINRELAALTRMFNLGHEATPPKIFYVPHLPKLTESNARQGFLEDARDQKLLESCMEIWFQAIVEICFHDFPPIPANSFHGMEEVIGSIPIRSTNISLRINQLRKMIFHRPKTVWCQLVSILLGCFARQTKSAA